MHEAFFIHADEADGLAFGACAAGASDAVHIVFRHVRNFIVDDVWQVININTACGNVGGDQCAQCAALEVGQRLRARRLAFVAVQRHGADAVFVEVLGDVVGTEFGTGEYQHLVPAVLLDDVRQQVLFPVASNGIDGLGDALHRGVWRCDLYLLWIAQQGSSQFADVPAKSGRKQQTLLVCRQQRQYFFHVMDETHIQHAIGFIQHQNFHA